MGHKWIHTFTAHTELLQAINFYDEPKTRALFLERFKKLWGRATTCFYCCPQTTVSQEMIFRLIQTEDTTEKVGDIPNPTEVSLTHQPCSRDTEPSRQRAAPETQLKLVKAREYLCLLSSPASASHSNANKNSPSLEEAPQSALSIEEKLVGAQWGQCWAGGRWAGNQLAAAQGKGEKLFIFKPFPLPFPSFWVLPSRM